MPYTQIHWIKLEKRLLNDYRFYTMSEQAQLFYIKLLLLSAETSNKIPKNPKILQTALRTNQNVEKIEQTIKEILTNFPKFKESNNFYSFKEWSKRHNYIAKKELQRNSQGTPKDALDKIRIDKIRKEYIREKNWGNVKLHPDDFSRTSKAIKALIIKAEGDDETVIDAIRWISGRGYEWTLETIIKKWADFMAQRPSKEMLAFEKLKREGK